MGRLGFAEAVYLLLMGELPTPAIGRMLNAVLVVVDRPRRHAAVARWPRATSRPPGAPLKDCVAAGHPRVRSASRRRHRVVHAVSRSRADADARPARRCSRRPRRSSTSASREHETPPGFGHRFHTRDPRAARLFQMALELELEGEHVRLIRAAERALDACDRTLRPAAAGQRRRRDRGHQRRPRLRLRARQRDLPDLAAARPHRARARGAHAAVADAADRSEGPRLRRRARPSSSRKDGNSERTQVQPCSGIQL